MAHSRALTRFVPSAPARRRGRVRRAASAVGRGARHIGRRVAPSLPLVGTMATAAGVGYLEGSKKLSFVPTLFGSRAATFGAIGFAATRIIRNPTVRMIGAAMAIAGAFDIGKVKGGGVSGFEDDHDGGAGKGGGF